MLVLAEGLTTVTVQRRTGASQPAIRRWRKHSRSESFDGLRPRRVAAARHAQLHASQGVWHRNLSVQRIGQAHGL